MLFLSLRIQLKYTQIICTLKFVTQVHIKLTKIFTKCPFWTFYKIQIYTQTLALPENHVEIFKNEKADDTSQIPTSILYFINEIFFIKWLDFLRYCPLCAVKSKI